jgi:hypothetical protein
MRRLFTALVVASTFVAGPRAQDSPLPEPAAFLAGVRAHMRTDRTLLSQYTYLERRRNISVSLFGRVRTGPEQLFEVYPAVDPGESYRRLIEVAGQPRDPRELARDDQKFQNNVLEGLRKREQESDGDRAKRLQREDRVRREEDATLDDLFRIYRMTLVERQHRDGRPMIVVDFVPIPGIAARTGETRFMKKLKGRAWVSEPDFELARVEYEMVEDVSIAGGLAGRIHKGTKGSTERRFVNNEVWLPAEERLTGSGRVLLRRIRFDNVVTYSGYRKFSVATDSLFILPNQKR